MKDKPLSKPCAECPFRKKSMKGYTGPYDSAAEIASFPLSDRHYPCHARVNQLIDSGMTDDDALAQASPCAGACSMMCNSCKLSRDPRMADAQREVGKRDDVFKNQHEMSDYHDA